MFPKTILYEFKKTYNKENCYHIEVRFDEDEPYKVYEWDHKPSKEEIDYMMCIVKECFALYHEKLVIPVFQNIKNVFINKIDGSLSEKEFEPEKFLEPKKFFEQVLNNQKFKKEKIEDILERKAKDDEFQIGDDVVILQSEHHERIGMVTKIVDIHHPWYYLTVDGCEVRYRKESIKKAIIPTFKRGDMVWVKLKNITFAGKVIDYDQKTSKYYIKGANEITPVDITDLKKMDSSSSGKKLNIGDIVFIKSKKRLEYSQFYGVIEKITNKDCLICFGDESKTYNEKFLTKV